MISVKLYLLSLIFAFIILYTVIKLVKSEKLSEEYSSIWILVSIFILLFTLFSNYFLDFYAFVKGSSGSGPEIVLFFTSVFLLFFLILISTKLSQYKKNIHNLSQELGLLRFELEKFKKEVNERD